MYCNRNLEIFIKLEYTILVCTLGLMSNIALIICHNFPTVSFKPSFHFTFEFLGSFGAFNGLWKTIKSL